MYYYSNSSLITLQTCHPLIQKVFNDVIKYMDCTIISGSRGELEQNEMFRNGLSKKCYPDSAHNHTPSLAVDAAPYNNGINWKDVNAFYYFAGFVLGKAQSMNVNLRWGGDWDMDNDLHDQTFMDLGHFELVLTDREGVINEG